MGHFKKQFSFILVLLLCVHCFAAVAFAQDEAADYSVLQAQQVYTVGYSDNHAPFSYTSEKGKAAGMAIEMMDYIAKVADITVEYVAISQVSAGDTNIDVNLSILSQDQLAGNTTKSDPYFRFQLMAMSETGEISYDGAVVGHLSYSAFDNNMVEEGLVGCTSKAYDSYDALQQAFSCGEIDYILASSLVTQQTDALEVVSVSTSLTLDAMLKFNDAMSQEQIDAFNAIIASLDTQEVYTIMLNAALATSATGEISVLAFGRQYSAQLIAAIAVLIALVVVAILFASSSKRKTLEHMVAVDELTGLMTEHAFKQTVRKTLASTKQVGHYYIISFDIDNFKYINEMHGYQKGTQTIKAFGKTLQRVFEGAICIARPFADNFLIFTQIAPCNGNICGKEVCDKCMDHCLDGLLGQDYRLITSAGIYEIVDNTHSLNYIIDCANIARRRGKGTYKRTEWMFTKALEDQIKVSNDVIASMERGIRDKEFKVYYQPKIDFKTETFAGAEALVRWFRADGKQFYPNEFISLFEQNGFIVRLDYYVLNEVCIFLAKHPDLPKISVNVSGKTFLEPDLVECVTAITKANDIANNRIELEVTESAIVNEFETIRQRIDALKALGFTISMDDFGAGLSSLNRLKDISIDVLKIDKEFLGLAKISPKGESIIESIIDMTKKIKVQTVAEGVETAEQVALLKQFSCDIAQGYYYARPMPEAELLLFAVQKQ